MKSSKVLIVDDDVSVCALLKRLLALHGYAADAVSDGGEAIDRLQSQHYDLMIIDRGMPNISGPEAVAIIRSSPRFRDLKIVMFTGASLTKEVDEAFGLGIDGYLLKPVNVGRLLHTVSSALSPA
jgi:CheY-like chemotaxis protein